jgi:undecaprenyl-phosphate 4-deoxy-4-formamido-L-arabinose transferase
MGDSPSNLAFASNEWHLSDWKVILKKLFWREGNTLNFFLFVGQFSAKRVPAEAFWRTRLSLWKRRSVNFPKASCGHSAIEIQFFQTILVPDCKRRYIGTVPLPVVVQADCRHPILNRQDQDDNDCMTEHIHQDTGGMEHRHMTGGKLSIVIPCYNSADSISGVLQGNDAIFQSLGISDYEYILVNDHSRDDTDKVIKEIARNRNNVTAVTLAKNCGQHAAIMAGFRFATGEYVATCEDDGQTNMEALGDMMAKLAEGYDVVSTFWKERDKRSVMRSWGTKAYCWVADNLLPNPEHVTVSIFFLARRYIIDEIRKYRQPYPFIPGLLLRTTTNIAVVTCRQLPRKAGRSGYNFGKLLRLWMDSFTAFSIVPLRVSSFVGFFTSVCGILFALVVVVRKLLLADIAVGWSSLVSIFLVVSGLILCVLGIMGEYVGRIYMSINGTPQFVVRDVTTADKHGTSPESIDN